MAMTKKEQEEVRELKRRLSILAALRWTEAVEEDVPIPDWKTGNELSTGWLTGYAGSDRPSVEEGCSSPSFHARGRTDKTTSQRPTRLYSTKLLALKALRHEMELFFAEKLATVDIQIAAEKGLSE